MNNAAAIASTLGLGAKPESAVEKVKRGNAGESVERQEKTPITPSKSKAKKQSAESGNDTLAASKSQSAVQEEEKSTSQAKTVDKPAQVSKTETAFSSESLAIKTPEMPLIIELKRKFPGKELFVLSLLYLQRNNRGLVQMTVGGMMGLYSTVFQDVIKDDTVRRSLKRLSDAGLTKTTSIPGNNSGYVYEIGDLLETETFSASEKEEFADLTEFVKSKLATASSV